jgi:hypothetical protein
MSIVFQVLVLKLELLEILKIFQIFWWRRQRLIVIIVDTFSVFVYTVFIYLYAVMLLRRKNSKNFKIHISHFNLTSFFSCYTFFIGQHSGMSVLTI